ncbi:MAG: glycosyltransferase [Proteobacteria bacterium]|nr:glycosyltransferase [Pseudomonadota bacterium]MBU1736841.1 glycosyltransferase [Pseudomonadota bacterium]
MNEGTRWLYIKNGDVADQLAALGECPRAVPEGGTEAFIGDFLRFACGREVLLLSCSNRKADLRKGRVRAIVLQTENTRTRFLLYKFMLFLYQFSKAFLIIIFYRPHRIICGSSGPLLWISFLAARLHTIPWIHSRHNRVSVPGQSKMAKFVATLDGHCMIRADGVICHGPYLKQELLEAGVQSARIHEFDVGFQDFISEAANLSPAPELLQYTSRPYVLYVGRMEEYKGIFDLFSALEERLKTNPEFLLIYAGGGRDLQQLKDRIAEKSLNHQVIVLGKVARSKIIMLLKAARILVVATRTVFPEGRCMAAMEGLALGIPVVAPDFGPFPYLIKPKVNGLLYRADNSDDLRRKIDSLLDDEAFYREIICGVKKTSREIITPRLRFAQAVQLAFAAAGGQ